jgi:hypothetical protein
MCPLIAELAVDFGDHGDGGGSFEEQGVRRRDRRSTRRLAAATEIGHAFPFRGSRRLAAATPPYTR